MYCCIVIHALFRFQFRSAFFQTSLLLPGSVLIAGSVWASVSPRLYRDNTSRVECPSGPFALRLRAEDWRVVAFLSWTKAGLGDVRAVCRTVSHVGRYFRKSLRYFETPHNFFINLPAVNELWSALRSENCTGGQRKRWAPPHPEVVKISVQHGTCVLPQQEYCCFYLK